MKSGLKSRLPADFFSSNRKKLRLGYGHGTPIILTGNCRMQRSADSAYPFRQDSSFWYFTGIEEPGYVLVMESDQEYLIAPKQSDIQDIFEGAVDHEKLKKTAGIDTVYDFQAGWSKLGNLLAKCEKVATLKSQPAYIDQMLMYTSPARKRLIKRLKDYNSGVKLDDLRSVVAGLRSVKSTSEIEQIQHTAEQTHDLYKILENLRKTAATEAELFAAITAEIIRRGIDFAYEPIIAAGKNALILHYTENNAPIDVEQFLLIDMAARVGWYNADITRTVVANPTDRHVEVYQSVLDVQSHAIGLLKPGVSIKEYEAAVQLFMGDTLRRLNLVSSVDKESIRHYYPHATSHFLGIDVHDPGNYNESLKEGMVLTVEPGIYIKEEGIGVRIEDMVVIIDKGCRVLSSAIPKQIDRLA